MWTPPPSYSRHHSVPGNQGVTIVLACPRCCPAPCPAPALHSALSLYLGCAGGAGAGAALLWVTGHLYVLAHTQEDSLRQQRSEHITQYWSPVSLVSNCVRYVDVAAGLGMLVSQSCLVWGVRAGGRIHQVKIVMKIVMKIVKMKMPPSPPRCSPSSC